MKASLSFLVLAVVFSACQKKQFFTESAEIDLVKKGNAAYLAGDWDGLKALYADTAKVLVNQWMGAEISVDQFIEMEKGQVSMLSEYKIGDDAIYEMVELDNGDRWVHSWLKWTGKYKNGKEVSVPVHLSAQVANGKIVWFGIIADNLPGYLAQQPDSTMVMK